MRAKAIKVLKQIGKAIKVLLILLGEKLHIHRCGCKEKDESSDS